MRQEGQTSDNLQTRRLTGQQFEQLVDSLSIAFDQFGLQQLARFGMNEDLGQIATGKNNREVAFAFVDWADRQGRLEELVQGAVSRNPGNAELRRFLRDVWEAPQPSALPVSEKRSPDSVLSNLQEAVPVQPSIGARTSEIPTVVEGSTTALQASGQQPRPTIREPEMSVVMPTTSPQVPLETPASELTTPLHGSRDSQASEGLLGVRTGRIHSPFSRAIDWVSRGGSDVPRPYGFAGTLLLMIFVIRLSVSWHYSTPVTENPTTTFFVSFSGLLAWVWMVLIPVVAAIIFKSWIWPPLTVVASAIGIIWEVGQFPSPNANHIIYIWSPPPPAIVWSNLDFIPWLILCCFGVAVYAALGTLVGKDLRRRRAGSVAFSEKG